MSAPRLELRAIEKRFGGVRALAGAHLEAWPGEILGLCGENGAGKSTLLKVLSGVHPAKSYEGEILVDGVVRRFAGTKDAQRAGIAIVHQELMLVPRLTVAENLALGREPRRFGLVDHARVEADAIAALARFGGGFAIDVRAEVASLGVGLQQVVEIVRALSLEARILVLDEPTAALTAGEADRLAGLLRDLRARGTTCVYVSHRMDEVFALCDRVTVLRDGRTERTARIAETTPNDVVRGMVGREVSQGRRPRAAAETAAEEAPARAPALSVRALRLEAAPGRFVVDGVSLDVAAGEVVALAGAMGSGRTATLSTLFGCGRGRATGEVRLAGTAVAIDSPARAIAAGLALVPEDRKGRGLVLGLSVAENLSLPSIARGGAGPFDPLAELAAASSRVAEIGVRGAPSAPVDTLSGGNQQKVVLGKWLALAPRVLLLDEPTRGVDVGAREEIYALVEALCERGVAVLLASSDLGEVQRLAHRVVVLRAGRVVGELVGARATQAAIVDLSTGAAPAAATGASLAARDGGATVPA